jgi:hypothetical protein
MNMMFDTRVIMNMNQIQFEDLTQHEVQALKHIFCLPFVDAAFYLNFYTFLS